MMCLCLGLRCRTAGPSLHTYAMRLCLTHHQVHTRSAIPLSAIKSLGPSHSRLEGARRSGSRKTEHASACAASRLLCVGLMRRAVRTPDAPRAPCSIANGRIPIRMLMAASRAYIPPVVCPNLPTPYPRAHTHVVLSVPPARCRSSRDPYPTALPAPPLSESAPATA